MICEKLTSSFQFQNWIHHISEIKKLTEFPNIPEDSTEEILTNVHYPRAYFVDRKVVAAWRGAESNEDTVFDCMLKLHRLEKLFNLHTKYQIQNE